MIEVCLQFFKLRSHFTQLGVQIALRQSGQGGADFSDNTPLCSGVVLRHLSIPQPLGIENILLLFGKIPLCLLLNGILAETLDRASQKPNFISLFLEDNARLQVTLLECGDTSTQRM